MDILPLGTVTEFGVIQGIHSKGGERSYFCLDDYGVVSLIPSELIGPKIEEPVDSAGKER